LNQPLRGPRVVLDARRTGGEQPFKHLQAPPERPKPPQPVVVQRPAPAPVRHPEPIAQPVAQPRQPELPASEESTELQYRIIRSRRADGLPYLLQRGTWSQRDGKRIFKLDWEKGFDDRAKAERHLEWVQQSEEELDAVEEETENEFELAGELAEV
jgi:hypothetical protein